MVNAPKLKNLSTFKDNFSVVLDVLGIVELVSFFEHIWHLWQQQWNQFPIESPFLQFQNVISLDQTLHSSIAIARYIVTLLKQQQGLSSCIFCNATIYSELFFVSAPWAQFCFDNNVTTGYQAPFLVPSWKLFTKRNNCTQTTPTHHCHCYPIVGTPKGGRKI